MDRDQPPSRPPVTASNWLEPPHHRWAFRHVEQFLPTRVVSRGPGPASKLPATPVDVSTITLPGPDGSATTVGQVLAGSVTDAWLVLHEGNIVEERYAAGMSPERGHLLMSVTKTVIGAVAGILTQRGLLDTDAPVSTYVPELAHGGYAGASVRHVLDMRSGVQFSEDYADPAADIARMEAAIGWRDGASHPEPGLYAFLGTLSADQPHGGEFRYRSCETDVLGWVCERATGASMADLISDLVWRPMGAEQDAALICDALGTPVHDGGLSACLRDTARFGQLILDGGRVDGRQVLSPTWLTQIWTIDRDTRQAFAASAAEPLLPRGWYRNQAWVVPGPHGDVLLCLGIYGQLVRVDPGTRTVMVKLSSWDSAQSTVLHDTLRACEAVAASLSGRPGGQGPRFRTREPLGSLVVATERVAPAEQAAYPRSREPGHG